MNENENENNTGEETEIETPEIEKTQEMVDAEFFAPVVEKKNYIEEIFDWIEIFSSALLTVILLFTFIFRLVTVQGPSMEYTLHGGEVAYGDASSDNLIISNLFYTPKRGDIVVIQVPNPSFSTPLIKRVIATEGEVIDFDFEKWQVIVYENEEAYLNGRGDILEEPYVNFEPGRYMRNDSVGDFLPVVVEPGKIFVMGDNRNHSSDSRDSRIGQVDVRNIVGRALLRVFPFNKFGAIE
ncbi:MAG: signal peptidase I [Oscillospiraceae bacterium]|nr:signal peptidase I [Oscillospiraceae bacterium]